MNSLARTHHRYSLVVAAATAVVVATLLLVLSSAGSASSQGLTGDGTGGVAFQDVGDGTLDRPVNVGLAPGESDKVYVVEQDGRVEVVHNDAEAGTFLDIAGLTNGSGEQGLLGLAFHPNYVTKHLVYAYYTDAGTGDIVVSEFEAPDPLDADESTRRKVIRIRHRFASNHNGGQLLFGPDGHLYMGTGDGGAGGDPRESAQDKRSLLGKLLRIDPVDAPGKRTYRTPAGNPYKEKKGRDEILARGLRNPFRFSFDGDRILIGDVGQNRFEEVDYEGPKTLRGANFGWDRWEGRKRYLDPADNEARTPKRKHHDKPIHVYSHSLDGHSCSITGGVVVNDPQLSNLLGRYLYADYCSGRLRSFVPALSGASPPVALDDTFDSPTSFTSSPFDQRVYVTSLDGDVKRLEPLP